MNALLLRRVDGSLRRGDANPVPTPGRWMPAFERARLARGGKPRMQELLEIRLLGPFEVLARGTIADVGGSKRQALLAMLALRQGRVVDVDTLVDGLWGEELPAAPRNALHHHVARLRAALGEESIRRLPRRVRAEGRAHVDAVRFEELLAETRSALRDGDVPAAADAVASALALWRGPALQGLTVHGVVQRRGTPARDAARRRARGAVRGQACARRASGARAGASVGARGQPLPGTAVGAADAGALPQRPPGGRPRDLPGGAARARRRAGARAGA